MKDNKELCSDLKERAVKLGGELREDFERYGDAIDPRFNMHLTEMLRWLLFLSNPEKITDPCSSSLRSVKDSLNKLSWMPTAHRYVHRGSVKKRLKRNLGAIEDIAQKYVVS